LLVRIEDIASPVVRPALVAGQTQRRISEEFVTAGTMLGRIGAKKQPGHGVTSPLPGDRVL
jgi:hypothetical protein